MNISRCHIQGKAQTQFMRWQGHLKSEGLGSAEEAASAKGRKCPPCILRTRHDLDIGYNTFSIPKFHGMSFGSWRPSSTVWIVDTVRDVLVDYPGYLKGYLIYQSLTMRRLSLLIFLSKKNHRRSLMFKYYIPGYMD